ncbi:peroxiredoxin [Castellaniella hirudinis]|uniref:peroxiredoxin n=1 Tax=Castellaniella hirudinis TaxID=1144617 RepID=UPI0039C0D866
MSSIATGQALPRLTAESTHGPFDSSTLLGRPFVLYFYPKDNTPGCTTESQDFRDLHDQFLAAGCAVYGISRDTLKSHDNFTAKQSLPFALIADPDETLCQLFDVMKLKNMYGKQVRGIERSTFLVNAQGILVQEWRKVRVPDHAQEVLQAAQNLAA